MRTNNEAFLRQTHADQGCEASFEEWLLADWTSDEHGYAERQAYLLAALGWCRTVDAKSDDYGDECVIALDDGTELRTPAYPTDCDYVRFVMDGEEEAYWCSDEWRDSPAEVVGAIVGCIKSHSSEEAFVKGDAA